MKPQADLILILIGGLGLIWLITANVSGFSDPLAVIRLLLGLAFVLFIPGYLLQLAIFPARDDLNGVTRLALSFSLSVAIITPLALVLNALPWGIRFWPIVISLFSIVGILLPVDWIRRSQLEPQNQFRPGPSLGFRAIWQGTGRRNRVLLSVTGGALSVALVSGLVMAVLPASGNNFTEFYVQNDSGRAENYPRQAVVGAPVEVTLGIHNLEDKASSYRIEIWAIDQLDGRRQQVGGFPPLSLKRGQKIEFPAVWRMPWAGEDQQVEFLLYINRKQEPYRQLRLWLNVETPSNPTQSTTGP